MWSRHLNFLESCLGNKLEETVMAFWRPSCNFRDYEFVDNSKPEAQGINLYRVWSTYKNVHVWIIKNIYILRKNSWTCFFLSKQSRTLDDVASAEIAAVGTFQEVLVCSFMWLWVTYSREGQSAPPFIWDGFSVCFNFNMGTENSFLSFYWTKLAANFRRKSFVRRGNMFQISVTCVSAFLSFSRKPSKSTLVSVSLSVRPSIRNVLVLISQRLPHPHPISSHA